jgi:hypothetical protein
MTTGSVLAVYKTPYKVLDSSSDYVREHMQYSVLSTLILLLLSVELTRAPPHQQLQQDSPCS